MIVRHGNMAHFTLFAALVAALALHLGAASTAHGRRTRPAGMAKPSGGLVEKAYSGKIIRVVDAQSAMPSGTVAEAVGDLRVRSQMPLSLASASPTSEGLPLQTVSSALRETGVGAAVVLVSATNLPLVTASPDGRWAVLNTATVAADTRRRSAGRLAKLLWGAAVRALGAGWSGEAASILAPCADARGLDALPAAPSPAEQNAAVDAARSRGIGLLTFATYRTACAQGWALAPTNDVQRAIWDEVLAIPSEPMRIEFDPKKGR